jgi:O-antigen/teichoic acid export membrane protein
MTRTRSSIYTYFSGIGYQAITLLLAIVTTPLLLRWLGEERYGAFRVILDWLGYLALLELGLGGALCPLLAKAVGNGDAVTIRQTLAAGMRAYLWVSVLALVAGLGLALVIPRLIPISAAHAPDLRQAWLVALAGLLVMPLSPCRALAEASQRGYWLNGLCILQSLVITGAALLLGRAGWGITGQCLAVALGALFFHGTLAWMAFRHCPGILTSVFEATPNREALQAIWKLNRPTLVRQVCFQVSVLSDGILVALLLGPRMVVPLFVTQRLALLAQAQLRGMGSATWAALAELHVQGQPETFNRRLIELTSVVSLLGMGVLVPIVAYNEHFVTRWVGNQFYGNDFIALVTAANTYLLSIFTLWTWCFVATGHVRRLLPVSIISAVINVAVSLLLIRLVGMIGPVLGTLIAYVATSLWHLPGLLQRVFGTPPRELARSITMPLLLGLPYGAGLWWIAHSHQPPGWLALLAEMGAAAILYWAFAWVVIVKRSERTTWIARVREALPRRLAA